ncbi:coiled-coil domain-containing protein 63 isoform X1 [Python bivittatus]|uniref:Coiled-coil domain-containing protein 63 isoform X1 n=2 Tax=Python bivittatus TaxID=176946 RepID=A0A9F5I9W2_PYTBI|nr:coiled-coil domain-containing protein 63 isoform X1 [Python bivittatus]XP_025018849.1 coiled-coil domain-containing protein 63 isoform X1 [Python bivittatus]XP_025018850.1 coiled-coil domain-containing protein 63 isoform X1 [Python bivittatus]
MKTLVNTAVVIRALHRRGSHARSENSDYTEKEKEMMAEVELRKLQQQFRIMVENRKSLALKTQQQLLHQEKHIHALKQEHDEINLLLSLTKSPRNIFMDDRNCMELRFLLQTKDEYDALIRATKSLIAELDGKIEDLEKKIKTQKMLVIKLRQEYDGKWLQKQIQLLDNRLNHVTIHFDTILTTNAKLREEIENLQCQKSIFEGIYSRLHKKLEQQKRTMDTSIEQSTQAYEQRVEALARISAMKERRFKDIAQFNIEFRELERVYDHETKLKAFMFIKLVDRSEFEEQAKKEEALKAKKRAKTKGESFESYEVAYMRLLKLTENGDISQLVEDFIEKEEKNFAYFSYVTELNNDMERLQKRIEDIQNEISQLKSQQKTAEDIIHGSLKEMEETLQKTTEDANQYAYKLKESSKILDHMKSAVDFLFKEIGCDATKIREHLGETGEITDQNLMQYFSILEKKSNDLLLIESFLRYKEVEGELDSVPMLNPFLGGSALLKKMDTVKIAPPSLSVDPFADMLEPLEGPQDHKNLRAMVLENQEKEKSRRSSVMERLDSGRDKKKLS